MRNIPTAPLRDRLAVLPLDRVLVEEDTALLTTADAVMARPTVGVSRSGGRLALSLGSVCRAVRTLVALDGWAEAIFLAPPTAEAKLVCELALQAGCRGLVTDRDDIRPSTAELQIMPAAGEGGLDFLSGEPSVAVTQTRWIVSSSGTTGKPKLISHCLASLTRTTRVDIERGDHTRWGMLYDYTRFAGLQVLLQSLLSGARLIVPAMQLPLAGRLDRLAAAGCTHLSATPTLWRNIVMTPGSERLPLEQITLGGEIADDRILAALRERYPRARITHIYASTEAGVGFSVNDGREGFPASLLENPPPGVELFVKGGQLFVRNTQVEASYLGSGQRFADESGYIGTGDRVELRGERYVFLGREDGVINVGGNKVHPESVERVLISHPGVAMARVSAKSSPITGALVVADVVPVSPPEDAAAFRSSVLMHCRAHLERHAVPAIIRLTGSLDINRAGKLTRN